MISWVDSKTFGGASRNHGGDGGYRAACASSDVLFCLFALRRVERAGARSGRRRHGPDARRNSHVHHGTRDQRWPDPGSAIRQRRSRQHGQSPDPSQLDLCRCELVDSRRRHGLPAAALRSRPRAKWYRGWRSWGLCRVRLGWWRRPFWNWRARHERLLLLRPEQYVHLPPGIFRGMWIPAGQ